MTLRLVCLKSSLHARPHVMDQSCMVAVAEVLQTTRERRGLSLQQVANTIHIPLHELALLEGGGSVNTVADPMYLVPSLRKYLMFFDVPSESIINQFLEVAMLGVWDDSLESIINPSLKTPIIGFWVKQTSVLIEQQQDTPRNIHPPQSAEYLLYLLLPEKDRETLPGDLEEEFTTIIVPKFGPRRAKLWYWSQVLSSIGPLLTRQVAKLLMFSWLFDRVRRWMQG